MPVPSTSLVIVWPANSSGSVIGWPCTPGSVAESGRSAGTSTAAMCVGGFIAQQVVSMTR